VNYVYSALLILIICIWHPNFDFIVILVVYVGQIAGSD